MYLVRDIVVCDILCDFICVKLLQSKYQHGRSLGFLREKKVK